MDYYYQKLVGALIGIARATDGNEHLITEGSTSVILNCLSASVSSEAEFMYLLGTIETEKRKMVPDCYLCANPCGRTDAYDLSLLDREESEIRNEKLRILSKLQQLASKSFDPADTPFLYQGLIAIGLEGCTAQDLAKIL